MQSAPPVMIHIARLRCHVQTDWLLEGRHDRVGYEITTGEGTARRWLKDYYEVAGRLRPGTERSPNFLAYVMDWSSAYYRFRLIERDRLTEDDLLGEVTFHVENGSGRLLHTPGPHTAWERGTYHMRGARAHYELELRLRDAQGEVLPVLGPPPVTLR